MKIIAMSVNETKRANFDLTSEQDAAISDLRRVLAASSAKDTVIRAVQLASLLASEMRRGNRVFVGRSIEYATRLVLPELEAILPPQWQWLVERPHPWKRQLWIKGRKLLASAVWLDALTNGLSVAEAAANWDLPLAATEEVFTYCEANQSLIQAEADEERQRVFLQGIDITAK